MAVSVYSDAFQDRTIITSFPDVLRRLPIVLASSSPRRLDILRRMGWENIHVFPCRTFQETLDPQTFTVPAGYAEENARLKGSDVSQCLAADSAVRESLFGTRDHVSPLIIAADTVIVHNNTIIEKPRDNGHAITILKALSGCSGSQECLRPGPPSAREQRTHLVITAVALYYKTRLVDLFSEVTSVTFGGLTPSDIAAYVARDESLDKAAGYGIQGAGACLVESIHGCFYNVQGLPLFKLSRRLTHFLLHNSVELPLTASLPSS